MAELSLKLCKQVIRRGWPRRNRKNMKDIKNSFTHSFFFKATAFEPPHQYPDAEVEPRRCRKLASGFTLVELMVVMSIIAMLMGILLPVLGAARRTSYRTMCKENLHGCVVAFRMYLNDNQNVMPTIINMPISMKKEDPKAPCTVCLYGVLQKYLSGREALKCPADRWPDKSSSYFKEEHASYEYDDTFMGPVFDNQNQKIEGNKLIRPPTPDGQTVSKPWAEIRILRDYSGFHGKILTDGTWTNGAYTYLYADNLISDRTRNE
jgi:prepilin-type N-terminal cleavage/methylation domain-containing protein